MTISNIRFDTTTDRIAALTAIRGVDGGGALLQSGSLLSSREIDLLADLGDGLANRQIAEYLCLSESTIRSNVSHLRQKIGLNRFQLALLWHYIARETNEPRPSGG